MASIGMTDEPLSTTYWAFGDVTRLFTTDARSGVAEALESHVPGSGSVGTCDGANDEVCFAVDARSDREAIEPADRYLGPVVLAARLDVHYTVAVQRLPGC